MTHLRVARVSDRRSMNGSSRRHRRGSGAINRDIDGAAADLRATGRYGFWRAVMISERCGSAPRAVGDGRRAQRQEGQLTDDWPDSHATLVVRPFYGLCWLAVTISLAFVVTPQYITVTTSDLASDWNDTSLPNNDFLTQCLFIKVR